MLLPVHDAILASARDSHSRLLSFIASRAGGDMAGAEDALGDAFLAAVRQWPEEGVPQRPEAWLLSTARRRLVDLQRREHTRIKNREALLHAMTAAQTALDEGHDLKDDRLKLLFVCAHPAIDPSARTPLMLQAVLGMSAESIASAFLVSPLAMSQRLVRAKTKIRDAGIPFYVPAAEEWAERVGFVLDSIYVAFTAGWDSWNPNEPSHDGLATEAIWLARVLVSLVPDDAEALGLLALMLHIHARQAARRTPDGRFVALTEQDVNLWSRPLMDEAEQVLRRASKLKRPGRFQIEAAIQSAHAQRGETGQVNWPMIECLYAVLLGHTSAIGARIGHALAVAKVRDPATALRELETINENLVNDHQPYWVARAYLLRLSGRIVESNAAYSRAIGLTEDQAVRAFLLDQMKS